MHWGPKRLFSPYANRMDAWWWGHISIRGSGGLITVTRWLDVYIPNSLVKTALQLIICFRFLLRVLPLKDHSPSLLVILCLRACMLRDEMHYKCSTRGKDDYSPDLMSHLVTTVLPASVCGGKHLIKCWSLISSEPRHLWVAARRVVRPLCFYICLISTCYFTHVCFPECRDRRCDCRRTAEGVGGYGFKQIAFPLGELSPSSIIKPIRTSCWGEILKPAGELAPLKWVMRYPTHS